MAPLFPQNCSNYMVLTPEKASIFNLIRFLWSGHIPEGEEAFVHFPKGKKDANLPRKLIVFLSLIAQVFLSWVNIPLKIFGFLFELWLNLLALNGNLLGVILTIIHGKKLILPYTRSPTYRSVLGFIDTRVELDKSIKPGDIRYTKELAAMASKLSYENRAFVKTIVTNHWEMELIDFYDLWNDTQKKYTTQAFMMKDKTSDPNIVVVAFRGTEPFDADAWSTDVDISWYEYPGMGRIHGGFLKALGLQENGFPLEIEQDPDHPVAYYTLREQLRSSFENEKNTRFIVTGHSLGGALAILFASILTLHEEKLLLERLEGVYTFGQPRVGDDCFKVYMEEQLKIYDVKYERIVYCNDLVPRVPADDPTLLFKHFGMCFYYNSFYSVQIVNEVPNKNYFDLSDTISKHLNAVWEFIRGFIIPFVKGPEYKESWTLKALRVFGLIIPGVSAHNTQDYVNVTRLGSF
ncbi:hypothetical protein UlMin_039294 [Ulmus minor]